MAEATDKVVETLNGLIQTCKDSENGFGVAANAVRNIELKKLFESYSRQRAQYVAGLQEEVRRRGGDPEKMGTVAGTLHQGWMSLKAVVPGASDSTLVRECRSGEEAALSSYEEARGQPLPPTVHALVEQQLAGIREAVERFRALDAVMSDQA